MKFVALVSTALIASASAFAPAASSEVRCRERCHCRWMLEQFRTTQMRFMHDPSPLCHMPIYNTLLVAI